MERIIVTAELSIDLHLKNLTIPKQVIVIAKAGSGKPINLPHETSLLVYSDVSGFPKEREEVYGLQIMPLAVALCKVTPIYFKKMPVEAELALQSLKDPSDLLRVIIENNYKQAASRLIGAYRFLKNQKMAEDLKSGLEAAGIFVDEINPFIHLEPIAANIKFYSPYAARIYSMWQQFRKVVVERFPEEPGLPENQKSYLNHISEMYVQDAYNSLSIEGYLVSKELVEKVKNAKWNPDGDIEDTQQRDALAARGYYEAFLEVKEAISKIFDGASSGVVVKNDLSRWFQKLFSPSVRVGILSASDLFGYRKQQVYIRNSRHTPPSKDQLLDAMDALFDCLQEEKKAAVRAVLGHFIFVYIHPYMDGNGRIGRFLMNVMFASGGYPWTIIHYNRRQDYIVALEKASVEEDILPFTEFVLSEMKNS